VRVDRDERAVLELGERVDLRQRHVVLDEQLRELGQDRGEAVELRAGQADRRHDVLRDEVHVGQDRREVPAPDVLGVRLGDLLDVDAAHVGEHERRLLGRAVVDDSGVVLLLDLRHRVDQHAAGHVAVDLELEDLAGVRLGLLGRVGELDSAGLHAAARQDLGLDDDGAADLSRDPLRFLRRGGEAVLGEGDPLARKNAPGLVFVEPHAAGQCIDPRVNLAAPARFCCLSPCACV
jgi:hypothetical protein